MVLLLGSSREVLVEGTRGEEKREMRRQLILARVQQVAAMLECQISDAFFTLFKDDFNI